MAKPILITQHKFQTKLKRQIFLYSSLLVLLISVSLAAYIFFFKTLENNQKLNESNQYVTSAIAAMYDSYREHLQAIKESETFLAYLNGYASKSDIFQNYYSFNLNNSVRNQLVILDADKVMVFSSFDKGEENQQLNFLNHMIVDRLLELEPNAIATSAFSLQVGKTSSTYIMGTSILDEGNVVGYAIYYLASSDLNKLLQSEITEHVVVCDMQGKVIATTSEQFIVNYNLFKPHHTQSHDLNDVHYLMRNQTMPNYRLQVYSLKYDDRDWLDYLQWMTIIVAFGICLTAISSYIADRISINNSRSLESLLQAVDRVKEGDIAYRIQLSSNDEFEVFANQFNAMLNELDRLNHKNVELMDIRRITEIKRLEAQFNPHFLFNTLETIRYGILLDSKLASDLTMKLTKILRYSINNNVSIVSLEEDLHYIYDFLAIQSHRFEDHFHYTIDVDEECLKQNVPKLVLQPLIENSCKYGFTNKDYLRINIKGYIAIEQDQAFMILSVEDNGMGIDEGLLETIRTNVNKEDNVSANIGLHNIKRRLVLLFGKDCDLLIESTKNFGTKVTLKIAMEGEKHV